MRNLIVKQTFPQLKILLLVKYELLIGTDFRFLKDLLREVMNRGRFIRNKKALLDLVIKVNQIDP